MSVEAKQQVPSIGRIVHWVSHDDDTTHHAAIIVKVLGAIHHPDSPVNLQVFRGHSDGTMLAIGVKHDATGTIPCTYHFPEYVPSVGA